MAISMVPFNEEDLMGVIRCLKRNYPNFGGWDNVQMEHWLDPVIRYKWSINNDVSEKDFPYKYGVTIKDDGRVVGWLGNIVSIRYSHEGWKYIYGSPTTWAIDKKYNMYLFKALTLLYSNIDVVSEFTARESVREILKKKYRFEVKSTKNYRFRPIPCFRCRRMMIEPITSEDFTYSGEIDQSVIKDHLALEFFYIFRFKRKKDGEDGYLFCKTYKEDSIRIRILRVINPKLFADNCQEIVWEIERFIFFPTRKSSFTMTKDILRFVKKKKNIDIECDSLLLHGHKPKHHYYKEFEVCRMFRNPNRINVEYDFLYSELACLNSEI